MTRGSGRLASRAVRQYRSRDIFPYLSLRYFLESTGARKDTFVQNNSIQMVRGSKNPAYLQIPYFKERNDSGDIQHRSMHMPSAAEALAEAALLDECSRRLCIPDRQNCFSYWLTEGDSSSGYFEPYLVGLKARQKAVASAIEDYPGSPEVRYLDIKTFYPSIRIDLAHEFWIKYCQESNISESYTKLGISLLERQRLTGDSQSLLTGPMFSHFIGNLILREIDSRFSTDFKTNAFRYVDDFILVGNGEEISHDVALLKNLLKDIGLDIHPDSSDKSISLSGKSWLQSERDFDSGEISISWMKLIGDIKKLLILNITQGDDLLNILQDFGFRLPVRAYESAVKEASTFEKIRVFGLWSWLVSKMRGVSSDGVRERALGLRALLEEQLNDLLQIVVPSDIFERKRLATKLRYRMGRALYVCDMAFLRTLASHSAKWPELEVHFALADALVSKSCDRVAAMGVNVAQAAAQLFAASDETAIFTKPVADEVSAMCLAVFIVNGVSIRAETVVDRPILQVATGPISLHTMEKSAGFLQQLSCLHGIGEARHGEIMSKTFDLGEDVHFDAISLDYGYSF